MGEKSELLCELWIQSVSPFWLLSFDFELNEKVHEDFSSPLDK